MNIDIATTQQRLCDLADRLDTNGNSSTAAHLRDLADAVAGGPSAPKWALVDIFRVFSPDDLAEQPRDGVVRWFEFFRNVLVLLPLIVTWVGIWTAVESYHSLIKDNPSLAAQSFVYLWQGGFEGRTWLTLSWVAIVDAALLFGVFVLTIVVYRRQLSSGRAYDGSPLREALVEADLALSVYRQPSGMSDLIQVREVLEQMAESLKQQPEQIRQSLQQSVFQVTQTMQQAGSQMAQTLQQTSSQMAQTLQQTSSQMAQTLQQTTSRLENAAQEVSASAHSLEQAHLKIQTAVTALSAPMQALAIQTKELGPAFQETSAKLQESVEKITAVGTLLRNLVPSLTTSIPQLIEAANTVEQAANGLSATAQKLASEQAGLINALTSEREAQTRLANMVSKATYDLDLALQQVKDSEVRLHGIAVDLTTIGQALPALFDILDQVRLYSVTGVKPRPQAAWPTSVRPQS